MSTPVRGGPDGPLGYAPPRARQAGTARANTAFDGSKGPGAPSPLPESEDTPPRIVTSLRDDRDSAPRSTMSLREALSSREASSPRDALAPRDPAASLREALSSRDGLVPREGTPLREALAPSPRDSLARDPLSREVASPRPPLPPREGLLARDALSRDASALRPPASPREGVATRDQLSRDAKTPMRSPASPREGLAARDPLPRDTATTLRPPLPPREGLPLREALASRSASPSRDPLSLLDTPPSRDTLSAREQISGRDSRSKAELLLTGSGTRTLLDEVADLGLAPSRDAVSRTPAGIAPTSGTDNPWKRKKRMSDVFEGDAALKELRSRLAAAPTDQAPEPPMAPPKTPIFASAVRLMGVVGLAAGGALGFLWITSPHTPHSANPQAVTGEEVALVSLRGVEPTGKPATQNIAAERTPDPAPSADPPPWAMANYTSDAADKAITPPVLPQPRTAGPPPRSVPRVAASPIQPVPAAVAPPPPAPAPAPPPVVMTPPPATPVAVTPLDRDEVNAMLVRARTFLSSGDVAAARVVLRRAAASDDPQAALALGGTYDPSVLKKLGIISFHADPAQAREWYRKAAALGSADASLRLDQLMQTADH